MGEELLRLWRETHATVPLITHSLDEAAMLAAKLAGSLKSGALDCADA
jgi:NitT/TauT family transport system ATP-binding protein